MDAGQTSETETAALLAKIERLGDLKALNDIFRGLGLSGSSGKEAPPSVVGAEEEPPVAAVEYAPIEDVASVAGTDPQQLKAWEEIGRWVPPASLGLAGWLAGWLV